MDYTITLNNDFNSLEVSFNGIPDKQTREALKKLKFKWHNIKKVWYGFTDEETLKNAIEHLEVSPAKCITTLSDEEKNLIVEYAKIKAQRWDNGSEKWVKYYKDNTAYVVKLNNGWLLGIEKPRIETRFCFGYGYCGVSDEEDYRAAASMEHYASTNEQYFINENLKELNEIITRLKLTVENWDDDYAQYEALHNHEYYWGNCKPCYYNTVEGACSLSFMKYYNEHFERDNDILVMLDKENCERILSGYIKVKEQFEKRINTYLKKYGLTKLHTWTYLSD